MGIILCLRIIVYLLIKLWLEKVCQDLLDRLNQEDQYEINQISLQLFGIL